MRDIEEQIEELMQGIQAEAQKWVDEYWRQRSTENEKRPTDDRSYLGVRTVLKGNAVRVEWFRLKPVKRRDGDHRTYAEYIRKGRQRYRYPDHVLRRHARAWQLEMVRECEDQFSRMRKQIAALVEMRKQARFLSQDRGLRFLGDVHHSGRDPTEEDAT